MRHDIKMLGAMTTVAATGSHESQAIAARGGILGVPLGRELSWRRDRIGTEHWVVMEGAELTFKSGGLMMGRRTALLQRRGVGARTVMSYASSRLMMYFRIVFNTTEVTDQQATSGSSSSHTREQAMT